MTEGHCSSTPDRAAAPVTTPDHELHVVRPALPSAPRAVRRALRDWLVEWSWPDDDLDDVVAAVDEAVSNVVDHAYRQQPEPGDVEVRAHVVVEDGHRLVVVTVADHGRWRPVPPDPGHRGRGLHMMSTCVATMHIEQGGQGTSVTLTSAPVAVPEPVR
ncbi:ATP-binding protein [Pseudonocardia humida]|uniref:ATP-binding protein n=1 Tax=Pseudonocardia humida TaxID=2800819 RepID=A0ABT0ZV16_9PSEU|nr:ATP-binding protein [Pseudonocardia humida]MCO1654577.1 ATP-binding protein [Pseudonocardia humida]